MGFKGMGFLSFFTCCIKLESCDVVIRCENSRLMTIFEALIYMACSSFSFWALQTSLRMCKTSTILHLMASICCSEWVASLDCHSCSRLVAFFCFFLSLATLLTSFLFENPLPSNCCNYFPCSITTIAFPLERRSMSLKGRNPLCPRFIFYTPRWSICPKLKPSTCLTPSNKLGKVKGVWNH